MMQSQFEVETPKPEAVAEGRGVGATRRWVQRALCVSITAAVGACVVVVLGQIPTSGGQPAVDRAESIQDIGSWNGNIEDPCIMARYLCMNLENQEQCESENAGSYCAWVTNPVSGEGTCIKGDTDSNDFCAAHDTDAGCKSVESQQYGCVWKEMLIFPHGGYCIEGEDAQSGCDAFVAESVCGLRAECEWHPNTPETQRRLQVPGFPIGSTDGKCLKKESESKNDCCTALGPKQEKCEKTPVSSVCEWDTQVDPPKCLSNGNTGGVVDDVNREAEEVCHSCTKYNCDAQYGLCVWEEGTEKCEPKVAPPS